MPLSVFDGEPTEELHEHYDACGNLTGTTVVTKPGWSDDDRAWALGLAIREASQCPHGHDLAESLDEQWKWIPQDPVICNACLAEAPARKKYEKDPRLPAMLFPAPKKVPRPQPKKRNRG